MNRTAKTLVFWLVIVVAAMLLWLSVKNTNTQAQHIPEISYSEFTSQVEAGNIVKVRIARTSVTGEYRNGGAFRVIVPSNQGGMLAELQEKGVEIWYVETDEQSSWTWLTNLAPLILLAALWYWMIRSIRANAKARNSGGTPSASV